MSKLFRVMLAVGLIAVMLMALNGGIVSAATPPEPTYGTADVDGDGSEWLASDFFAEMKNGAGKLEAKLYLRYDCETQTLYALALPAGDSNVVVITGDETDLEDVWIKIGTSRYHHPDLNDPPSFDEFAWINERTESGRDVADGWEASLSLDPGTYDLQAHTNTLALDDGEWEEQTAGTGTLTLVIDCTGLASIGDYVWHDVNMNGLQDDGESGLDGVTVNLYDGSGNFLKTTTTSGGGYYIFEYLVPGDYYVEFVPPPDYDFSRQDQGDDALDSDADPTTGFTTVHFFSNG